MTNKITDQENLNETKNKAKTRSKKNNSLDFEDNMKKLEDIVKKMEGEELKLDSMMKLFEEGVKLTKICNEILDTAEQKVEILKRNENEDK